MRLSEPCVSEGLGPDDLQVAHPVNVGVLALRHLLQHLTARLQKSTIYCQKVYFKVVEG